MLKQPRTPHWLVPKLLSLNPTSTWSWIHGSETPAFGGLWSWCFSGLRSIFESVSPQSPQINSTPLIFCAVSHGYVLPPSLLYPTKTVPSPISEDRGGHTGFRIPAIRASYSKMRVHRAQPNQSLLSTSFKESLSSPASTDKRMQARRKMRGLNLKIELEPSQWGPRFWILFMNLPSPTSITTSTNPYLWSLPQANTSAHSWQSSMTHAQK